VFVIVNILSVIRTKWDKLIIYLDLRKIMKCSLLVTVT